MEHTTPSIQVSCPLHLIEFLSFSEEHGYLSEVDRQKLALIVQYVADRPSPGDQGLVWTTPTLEPEPDGLEIEFGGASEVFNSITAGNFDPQAPRPSDHPPLPNMSCPPPSSHQQHHQSSSGPELGYIPVVPQPGTTPQHIHINNFTANLTYHATGQSSTSAPGSRPSSIGPPPIPRQPLPFATYPLNYVAPFPQSSPTPPVFSAPCHPIMIYPPGPSLHFSMYPPGHGALAYPPGMENPRETKAEGADLMFGSTPVVSVKHSSSDEEQEETALTAGQPNHSDISIYGGQSDKTNNDKNDGGDENESHDSNLDKIHPSATHDSLVPSMINSSGVEHNILQVQLSHRSNDTEVEDLCHDLNKMDMVDRPPTNGYPLHRSIDGDVVLHPTHRPTPPPFPLVNAPGRSAKSSTEDLDEVKSGPKSWASLFDNTDPSAERIQVDKPMARIPPFSSKQEMSSSLLACTNNNQFDKSLGEFLKSYQLKHVAPSFLPRGLTNRSNWCFVNAILAALLACPPFYNLLKDIQEKVRPTIGRSMTRSATPMINSLVELVNEYNTPLEAMVKNQKRDKGRKREDLPVGNAFEPSYVYKILLESDTFKVVEGRQEDAEEFLTYLLNMMDDEMQCLIKLTQPADEIFPDGVQQNEASSDDNDWKEMNCRGRSCVTRRVRDPASITTTPIQMLASGMIRSSVRALGRETSAILQPFFALQLDIQANSVQSVEDALIQNFSSESIDGYICPKTDQVAEATRTQSLEGLPPTLILHLKRMVYNGTTGGCQKVMKEIAFPIDLEINRDILSVNSKTRYTLKQRQYKLFGVVYHNGREATKGHYVADVYHTGYVSWLRCDDSSVKATVEHDVVTPTTGSAPYILFYRRCDTMVGVEKSK